MNAKDKRRVSEFNTNPHSMARLYFVHCPCAQYSDMYKLQPRQCVAVFRLMSLLLDGYEGGAVKALPLHSAYVTAFGNASYGVVHGGLLLLKKANYVDCDAVEANNAY